MEKMTFIFFIIIVSYLAFAFIKSRVKKNKKLEEQRQETDISQSQTQMECSQTERAAIVAAIAAVMGNSSFVVKRVYAVAAVNEKISSWRTAGRIETMTRKRF